MGNFSVPQNNSVHKVLALDDCGVVPFTQQNVAAIERGINEKRSEHSAD
jgi:hypothetical protein